jgi:transcriptional regulator with XRE-family HTH domain
MKERLLEFLKAENKSSAQFAEEIGVQPSGISHILSGRNNPSLDFILKMLDKYKFLSTEWLLFGKGSMYKDQKIQNLFDESENIDNEPDNKQIENFTKAGELTFNDNVNDKTHIELPIASISTAPEVEKIVWFFNDKSFKEYFPSERKH